MEGNESKIIPKSDYLGFTFIIERIWKKGEVYYYTVGIRVLGWNHPDKS